MCKWGTTVSRYLPVSARRSHTGTARMKTTGIDSCIAPIVDALNNGGIPTEECCCGHGKEPGYIGLMDDRVLVILESKEAWEHICAAVGPTERFDKPAGVHNDPT